MVDPYQQHQALAAAVDALHAATKDRQAAEAALSAAVERQRRAIDAESKARGKPRAPVRFALPTQHEQAALSRLIGERLKAARELCNLSQQEAARRLGYANSSKLAKVENATNATAVPPWLIERAAKLYEVSVDYLFGASQDWDIGPRAAQERDVSRWLFDAWQELRQHDLRVLRDLHRRVDEIDAAVRSMLDVAGQVDAALVRFAQVNPGFEDMRVGATLTWKVDELTQAARHASAKLERFRSDCRGSGGIPGQLVLPFEPGTCAVVRV